MRGWGKFFVARRKRVMGVDPSESLHPSAALHDLVPPLDGAAAV